MTTPTPEELRHKAHRCRELADSLGNLRDQAALNEFADILNQQAGDLDGGPAEGGVGDGGEGAISTLLSALQPHAFPRA